MFECSLYIYVRRKGRQGYFVFSNLESIQSPACGMIQSSIRYITWAVANRVHQRRPEYPTTCCKSCLFDFVFFLLNLFLLVLA